MKNLVVVLDLNGILDLSNPILHHKLDNTFMILQPSCALSYQWARCCELYHIAKKNKVVLDIYFLSEEKDIQDILDLEKITHPYLDSIPELLKNPRVKFHYLTWRSLTLSKRADNSHKVKINKNTLASDTQNKDTKKHPRLSHIVLDTMVSNLRTADLVLEKRFVLPMSLLFILNADVFFKYPANPINGYHHFIIKTSDKVLKNAIFRMHTHYQRLNQAVNKDFDKFLNDKLNPSQLKFYQYDIKNEAPALPVFNHTLATPLFYTPTQDEALVKNWLTQKTQTFITNVNEFELDIDKWFKHQSFAVHRQTPNSSLKEFLTYIGTKETIDLLTAETLENILAQIDYKHKSLIGFVGELNFSQFIHNIKTWQATAYQKILYPWIRIPSKWLFVGNLLLMSFILFGILFTSTAHTKVGNAISVKFLAIETLYFQIGLAVVIINILLFSLGILALKRRNTKKAIAQQLAALTAIESGAIAHSKEIEQKYHQQLEILTLGKNQTIVLSILDTYHQYKDQLSFITKTLTSYELYTKINNPDDDNMSGDNIPVDLNALFKPIKSIEILQWGIHQPSGGTELHNLTADDSIKKSDDFLLMQTGLFGIEAVYYK